MKQDQALTQRLSIGASNFAAQYLTRDYALQHFRDVLLKIGEKKF